MALLWAEGPSMHFSVHQTEFAMVAVAHRDQLARLLQQPGVAGGIVPGTVVVGASGPRKATRQKGEYKS